MHADGWFAIGGWPLKQQQQVDGRNGELRAASSDHGLVGRAIEDRAMMQRRLLSSVFQ